MGRLLVATGVLALAVASARAASIGYVTDLDIFSALSALSWNIQWQTYEACPKSASDLQSCVCTKNNNLASISSKISASVSDSCGSMASDDQSSAQAVLSAYCNPGATVTFASPTAVSVYITDIPEVSNLAPCARSAMSYVVQSMTYTYCPSDAPALASCACLKNQNSVAVSRIIYTSVKEYCAGHTADISSAEAMFAAYCAMNNGTSSFPQPSNPPGDMTYYITDLPQYSSLAPCAAEALSYAVRAQTFELCPNGPQALASCVCLKDGMTSEVLKELTSSVKEICSSTATEDVTSAVAVFDFYCSAAAAQVTAGGVTASVEQTYPASGAAGGPKQTGGSGSGGTGSSGSNQGGTNSSSGGPSTPVIVGIVVGVVGGLAVLSSLIYFLAREARKRRAAAYSAYGGGHPGAGLLPFNGKSELPSDSAAAAVPFPSRPSQSTPQPGAVPARVDNVSPVSAHATTSTPPPNQAELSGQSAPYPPMPNRPELLGQAATAAAAAAPSRPVPNAPELYGQGAPQPNRPELYGQTAAFATPPPNQSELQGQGAPFYATNLNQTEYSSSPPPNQSELQGQGAQSYAANLNRSEYMYQHYPAGAPPPGATASAAYGQQTQSPAQPQSSWQSGPVPAFHEMDGGSHGMPQR
ncbi:cbddf3d4-5658-4a1e-a938-51918f1b561a [Thermothielavioides terrestris]|uniref:Cbddf3d4-5658-4a1e-a938-51918f1b561a n=1 Tax=Thermothielavioides terrestris TaxID=2587410 RepID=A0A446BWM8_9PEZI|nr:cbddf3d4-5658-4a1e-a938-51918f1b561a [Thermothielavioides terrestris]